MLWKDYFLLDPKASNSYRPSDFFFELPFQWTLRASLSWTAHSMRWMGRQRLERKVWLAVSAVLSLSFASRAALLMPFATSISVRYPFTRLSSGRMTSGGTMCLSKQYFLNDSYERFDNLGVVQNTLIGILGFCPKCAFKGTVIVAFCLQIRNWWKMIFNACFMCNYFVADFSSLKHATIFLIVCINLSSSPIARWSSDGVSIVSALFLLQSFFTMSHKAFCLIQSDFKRYTILFNIHFEKFRFFWAICLSNIHEMGN